jgi:cytochrome c-type protein NapC
LTLGGFLAGIGLWGGFNTALEATNTERFCITCHEMRDNVYADLRQTVHFTNRSGVRATCPDCHVPHEWTAKIAMDITKQSQRAAQTHERFLFTGEKTCIDCHKGIAHRLPDMTGVPGWQ